MITFGFNCGFWMICRDGVQVADTGGHWLDKARAKGIQVNHTTWPALRAVCSLLGEEYSLAYDAWAAALPKGKAKSNAQLRAECRRQLKGFA